MGYYPYLGETNRKEYSYTEITLNADESIRAHSHSPDDTVIVSHAEPEEEAQEFTG